MLEASKGQAIPLMKNHSTKKLKIFPQMTQIDADNITQSPGLYLRYQRDLRTDLGWKAGMLDESQGTAVMGDLDFA